MTAVAPAAAAPPATEVVSLLDSDDEQQHAHLQQERAASGQAAGPSRAQPTSAARRRRRQQQQQEGGAAPEVIDLTSDSPPDEELQVVRSTVQRVPMRGTKRPRPSPAAAQQLSPMKQMLLQQLRAPPPPPPPEPEPEGPKCGICMESMGGSTGRTMASGNCGHVYCYECLVEAVRAQKKCPTCRKNMQQRQIHKVFIQM